MPNASERWEASNETEQPSDGRMGRRLFLGTAIAGTAALWTGVVSGQTDERTSDVNEFARNFPHYSELKGIDRITTDLREHAKHLLVHLRIIHWHDDQVEPEDIRRVEICQSQWNDGLQSMIDHPRIKLDTVYAEGMLARGTPRLYSNSLDVQSIKLAHALQASEHRLQAEDKPDTGTTLVGVQAPKHEAPKEYPILVSKGADYHLYNEGKIDLWGTEWWDAQELCDAALQGNWQDADKYIYDLRERAALEIIAADRTKIAYVFYGAAHRWSDNITQWNAEHPDEAFSLMEISPDCIIDDVTGREVRFEDPRYKLPPPPSRGVAEIGR